MHWTQVRDIDDSLRGGKPVSREDKLAAINTLQYDADENGRLARQTINGHYDNHTVPAYWDQYQ